MYMSGSSPPLSPTSEAAEEEGERNWGPPGDSQGEGRERGEMRAAKKMWKKVETCFTHFSI
jgi:hypothetical protein